MQLSKSEYIMFLKHPAWLWLKKHDKDKLPEPDVNLQAIFDAGIEFEKYAEERFPDGVRLGFENYDEYLSLPKRTKKALKDGAEVVFQGRFEGGGKGSSITCICDIVHLVDNNTFDLYEIKSSTRVKPEHTPDLAFQVVVLESAGFKARNISVVHVNRDYVRDGEIDPEKLSTVTNVTAEVRDKIEETKENIQGAFEIIESLEMPDPSPRHVNLGAFNDWLEIYKGIKDIDPYSIYNLIAPGVKRIGKLEDIEVELIKNIPDGFQLTPKQQAQVTATKIDDRLIDKDNIKSFLSDLVYPLYFLDYETAMSTIPLWDGTRPYQQIPFQYSLHVIEKPGADPKHTEYLHRDESHPVPKLLENLKNDISHTGNVIVWYKSFETGRNKEMAEMFPEFAEFLEDVNNRVVDLMIPFSNGWFVDKDFFGAASIKSVLPVLVPDLSYKELDIQEGFSAQRLWMDEILKEKGDIDKEKLFNNLVEYCKLDTLAMVKIWEVLESV